jgi:4-amino-4-deoxy-L-arabinose transferase-like glycosyltransferase
MTIICLLIFATALSVRLLSWHNNHRDATKVQTVVTYDYKAGARQLLSRDIKAFVSDVDRTGHPPGYPIFLAAIFRIFGIWDSTIQFVQIIFDSLAAVVIFLIAFELLTKGVAITAAFLAALSPQFAYYPLLILPDSIAVLPILLAVYCVIRASKRPRVLTMIGAGVFVGLSCWLRANALLLAPFLAATVFIVFDRGKRSLYAVSLVASTVLIIAPITIKNYVVFGQFIPLSLGAGQTLLEGIAEHDSAGTLGVPKTDLGIMAQEAAWFNRPDYAERLFGPDGFQRDRMRLARGVAIIRAHPFWYLGVMLKRAGSLFRIARVPIASPGPGVTHSLEINDQRQPVWSNSPAELLAQASIGSELTKTSLTADAQLLQVTGDSSKYAHQIISQPIKVKNHTDYLIRFPIMLEQGRMVSNVLAEDSDVPLASTNIDLMETRSVEVVPSRMIALPFVTGNASQVRTTISNGGSTPVLPVAKIGRIELFELGPSSYEWTRYPRLVVRNIQRLFITAWMLILTIAGLLFLIRARQFRTLVVLLTVPVYYLSVQSALHTEQRYVIAMHYFLIVIAAVSAYFFIWLLSEGFRRWVIDERRLDS